MTLQYVLSRVVFDSLRQDQETFLRDAITDLYMSPTGSSLLEAAAALASPITFAFDPVRNGASSITHTIYYAEGEMATVSYLSSNGQLFQQDYKGVLAHELTHYLSPLNQDPTPQNWTTFGFDYVGPATANEISALTELNGLGLYPLGLYRVDYFGVLSNSSLSSIDSYPGGNLTQGKAVNLVIVDHIGDVHYDVMDFSDHADNVLLIGLEGNDDIQSGAGQDYLYGGSDNDLLKGGGGADRLYGNSGADILVGRTGDRSPNLTLYHGEWNDSARDIMFGGAGADTIFSSTSNWIYNVGWNGANMAQALKTVDFVDGSDQQFAATFQIGYSGATGYYLSASFNLTETTLANAMVVDGVYDFGNIVFSKEGQAAEDIHVIGRVVKDAELGNVLLFTTSEYRSVIAIGGVMNWTPAITGSNPAGIFDPGDGGNNNQTGGDGDDTHYGQDGNDVFEASLGDDYYDGGAGTDTLDFSNTSAALTIVFPTTSGGSTSAGTAYGSATGSDMFFDIENVTTGSGNDDITGSSAANTIKSDGGTDTIHGGAGDDIIQGGGAGDKMFGEAGSDSYYVDNASDVVTEASGQGTDTVYSTLASAAYTLTANVENLILQGSATDGIGNGLANTITGNTLNNLLDGGAGADALIGSAGNDTYVVDNASDVVTELTGEGTDLIQSSVTMTALAANVEKLTLTGTGDLDGTGNGLDNVINGNNGVNNLSGGTGADTISAKNGADRLNGGGGNDVLTGGNGSDNLTGAGGADTFIFTVGSGTDRVTDFLSSGADIIDLSGVSEITNINNLRNQHATDMGSYVVIDWNGGSDTVRLDGIANISDLVSANFIFA